MAVAEVATERKVNARDGALAWMNAAIACGKDAERPALYRTVRVEFYPRGVQFIACDGHMIFRTWAPYSDIGDLPAPQPLPDEAPDDCVTVLDAEQFTLGFMRTLFGATSGSSEIMELAMTIDEVDEEQASLGAGLGEYVLTLHALGQRLSCKLFDGEFPNWRALELGVPAEERMDGMTLAPKLFAAVGKLKGVTGVDLTFRGETKAIDFHGVHGSVPVCGLLMPMRRPTDRGKSPKGDCESEQTEHGDGEE